jgi:hypothetical protein
MQLKDMVCFLPPGNSRSVLAGNALLIFTGLLPQLLIKPEI